MSQWFFYSQKLHKRGLLEPFFGHFGDKQNNTNFDYNNANMKK